MMMAMVMMMMTLMMMMMSRGGDGAVIDSSRRTPLYYAVEKAGLNILHKELMTPLILVLSFEQNVHPWIIGIHKDRPDPVRV